MITIRITTPQRAVYNEAILLSLFRCCIAVILPTLWDYLHLNFGASKFFYGLTLSAFSMANLLSGPLFGLTFDYTRHTKLIVMFGNLLEIGGQYNYLL